VDRRVCVEVIGLIDAQSIATIITAIATIVAVIFGKKYSDGKNEALDRAEKVTQLLNDVIIAAKDNAVTEEEFQKIVDDAKACVD
jgi:hypothetical protein